MYAANIAPTDDDVWSVEYYEGKTHTSPEERAAFAGVVDAGFTDVTREHTPGPGTFTYWDYTRLAFPKRRGMRIDFCLGSPALAGEVTGNGKATQGPAHARSYDRRVRGVHVHRRGRRRLGSHRLSLRAEPHAGR